MNLSAIERLARNGDMSTDALRFLLECNGECERLDFKEQLHIDLDVELCKFAKDVIAIKNTGGGFIVVGVVDKTWEPRGLPAPLPYDTKALRDKVRKAAGVDVDVDIVNHESHMAGAMRRFALILVRPGKNSATSDNPTVVKKNFCSEHNFGLQTGEIYVRNGDSTVKLDSGSRLRELFNRRKRPSGIIIGLTLVPILALLVWGWVSRQGDRENDNRATSLAFYHGGDDGWSVEVDHNFGAMPLHTRLRLRPSRHSGEAAYIVAIGGDGRATVFSEDDLERAEWAWRVEGPQPTETVILLVTSESLSAERQQLMASHIEALGDPPSLPEGYQIAWTTDGCEMMRPDGARGPARVPLLWNDKVLDELQKVTSGFSLAGRTFSLK